MPDQIANDVPAVTATAVPAPPPAWATAQRRLFDVLDESFPVFLERYVDERGWLKFRDSWPNGRDGADDLYEAVQNWPTLYRLGGAQGFLDASSRLWWTLTEQLTELGLLVDDYERGYDWFHQSEGNLLFFALCEADPLNPEWSELALRFARLYTDPENPAANYDPDRCLIRAPHTGAEGPRAGFMDGDESHFDEWFSALEMYGLPVDGVEGVRHMGDLDDPVLARRMQAALQDRFGRGDTVANLCATALAINAYLLLHDRVEEQWIPEYTGAWLERAREAGGLVPDNVGPNGRVGELFEGRWYGGLYGWRWPHGYYSVGAATTVAAVNAFVATGDPRFLDLPRWQFDSVMSRATVDVPTMSEMTLAGHFPLALRDDRVENPMTLVPYRHGDDGWFDPHPMISIYIFALWFAARDPEDAARIEDLRSRSHYDWSEIGPFRTKEDAGHEEPWWEFINGRNPDYPERVADASAAFVEAQVEAIRNDASDPDEIDIHHWQIRNPVTTEALIQLTTGAPQRVYYGGLQLGVVHYVDVDGGRPGLPHGVAALVTDPDPERVQLSLVNTETVTGRCVAVVPGTLHDRTVAAVRYSEPGSAEWQLISCPLGATHVEVSLPPGASIDIELEVELDAAVPSYRPRHGLLSRSVASATSPGGYPMGRTR